MAEISPNATTNVALYFVDDAFFVVVFTVQIALSALGATLNGLLGIALRRSWKLFNANARVLLLSITCANFYICCHGICRASAWIKLGRSQPIGTEHTVRVCQLAEMPRMMCMYYVASGLFATAVERIISLRNPKQENNEDKTSFGVYAIITFMVAATSLSAIIGLVAPKVPIVPRRHCLLSGVMDFYFGVALLSVYVAIEISGVVCYRLILSKCNRLYAAYVINRTEMDLPSRVRLNRNIELTQSLLSGMTVHACCFIPWLITGITNFFLLSTYVQYTEVILLSGEVFRVCVLQVYCILFAAICLRKHDTLRKKMCAVITCGGYECGYCAVEPGNEDGGESNEQDERMKQLTAQWENAFEKTQRQVGKDTTV